MNVTGLYVPAIEKLLSERCIWKTTGKIILHCPDRGTSKGLPSCLCILYQTRQILFLERRSWSERFISEWILLVKRDPKTVQLYMTLNMPPYHNTDMNPYIIETQVYSVVLFCLRISVWIYQLPPLYVSSNFRITLTI